MKLKHNTTQKRHNRGQAVFYGGCQWCMRDIKGYNDLGTINGIYPICEKCFTSYRMVRQAIKKRREI